MGETRVDLLHLLEDLRDAYPGTLEETILTEVIANALDSGASRIELIGEPASATFTVIDNGSGMQRRELAHYHDIASSSKTRGQGIGFAGVGIKLGLLVAEEVVTETRRGKTHVATSWALTSRTRAPWRWVAPPGLVLSRGTAVSVHLRNPLSPLLDSGYLESAIRRHFAPLLDPTFASILRDRYPQGVHFLVNGESLAVDLEVTSKIPLAIRMAGKRKPSAAGYLELREIAIGERERGVALSTFGKVIMRGWDWLGLAPAAADRVTGLIEAPRLAECLTLNKADFIRAGARGATYLALRKTIQKEVTAQLSLWGDRLDTGQSQRRRSTRAVERDLEKVLVDLACDFPLLVSLVERRFGGQRRLPFGRVEATAPILAGATQPSARDQELLSNGKSSELGRLESEQPTAESPERAVSPARAPLLEGLPGLPGGRGRKRPANYGLMIQFEAGSEEGELGRLVESTVWVNDVHPAYRRAAASRSEGYHLALTVAMVLAPLAVEPREAYAFVNAFLARWGDAEGKARPRRRRRPTAA